VIETRDAGSSEVEERMERLCLAFEEAKPYLISKWNGEGAAPPAPAPSETRAEGERASLEV
jgi:hypothetical protein